MSSEYSLVYHAKIPGRAEPIRLFFAATWTAFEDTAATVGQSAVFPFLDQAGAPGAKFAPPVLVHREKVLSQTSNILLYLSTQLPPIDLDGAAQTTSESPAAIDFRVNELALTLLDLTNEVHDTHHPLLVSAYYEEQKDTAIVKAKGFRDARLPKFLRYFEYELSQLRSGFLLAAVSYADLLLFQVVEGLSFAFPNLMRRMSSLFPLVFALYAKIQGSKRIAAYLSSSARIPYGNGVFRHYPELDE